MREGYESNCHFFGQDLIRELSITLDFQNNIVSWQSVEIPMKPKNCAVRCHFNIEESLNI